MSKPSANWLELVGTVTDGQKKTEFRKEFQRALRMCVSKGFLIEEAFGLVWEETIDQFNLPESALKKLYQEMILWAKISMKKGGSRNV